MNILLWILQVLLGIYFIAVGMMYFFVPLDLPQSMSWMYDLSPGLHYFIGTAETLGGLGLIMPGIVNVRTRLTPLAGAGLVLIMIGAVVWHAQRSEFQNIGLNLFLGVAVAFVAYGRWKLEPLAHRNL